MTQRSVIRIALSMAVLAGAPEMAAEVFRCTKPDGSVVYTDRQETCPGADSHEPARSLQEVDPVPAAQVLSPARKGPSGPQAGARPGVWREKKVRAERELEALAEKRATLEHNIGQCNRRRKILERDESGLYAEVSCKDIREQYAKVKEEQAEISEYLEVTLERECRRTGCLPGWIR